MSGSSPTSSRIFLPKRRHSRLVLGVRVGPEPVALGLAVDDRLDAELVEQLDLVRRRHDADRRAAAVEHVLHGVAADAAGGAPDEHGVALLHAGAVVADEHAVARRVAQRVDRRLLPREVGRLGHQLVGLDDGEVGEAAEVGLEAPDPLVGGEHRVVVRRRVLVVDGVAVDRDPVAGLPVAHRRADAQHDARRRRSRRRGTAGRGGPPTSLSRAKRSRKPNVGSGSKIDVHTVLKLMLDAITATYGLVRRQLRAWRRRRCAGSCAGPCRPTSMPANISASSRRTKAAR